jgi:hypothetical protein
VVALGHELSCWRYELSFSVTSGWMNERNPVAPEASRRPQELLHARGRRVEGAHERTSTSRSLRGAPMMRRPYARQPRRPGPGATHESDGCHAALRNLLQPTRTVLRRRSCAWDPAGLVARMSGTALWRSRSATYDAHAHVTSRAQRLWAVRPFRNCLSNTRDELRTAPSAVPWRRSSAPSLCSAAPHSSTPTSQSDSSRPCARAVARRFKSPLAARIVRGG